MESAQASKYTFALSFREGYSLMARPWNEQTRMVPTDPRTPNQIHRGGSSGREGNKDVAAFEETITEEEPASFVRARGVRERQGSHS